MSSTTQQIGSAVKTFAKIGIAVILQIILFTIIGVVLNVIFVLFLMPEMGICLHCELDIITMISLLICFLILFPFIYFFLGKKQGVKAGISKLIHEKGNSLIGFIVSKFTDKMANEPKWNESVKQNGIVKTVRNVFPGFIRKLNGLPWLLKRPLKIVFETIDFGTAIEDAVNTRPDAPINSPETNAHITESVANKLKAKFPPPKGRLLLTIVIINVVIGVAIKIIV